MLDRRARSLPRWLEDMATRATRAPNTNKQQPPQPHTAALWRRADAEGARLGALLRGHVGGVARARKVLRQRSARGARRHACARRRSRSEHRPVQSACTDSAPLWPAALRRRAHALRAVLRTAPSASHQA